MFTTGSLPGTLPPASSPNLNRIPMYGAGAPQSMFGEKKLRFTAEHREALGRCMDYLVSLKQRGHGNWQIGNIVDGPDGKVHFDVVTFQEDPEFDVNRLTVFIPEGVAAQEVPIDVKPSEPITTARQVEAKTSYNFINAVLLGQDPALVVEQFANEVVAKALNRGLNAG